MGSFGRVMFSVFGALILFPVLKRFITIFTDPTTGVLAAQGVDEGTIAMINLIPWIVPLLAVIYVVVTLSHRNDEDDDDTNRYNRRYPD